MALPRLNPIGVTSVVHWFGRKAFEQAGFEWSVRRSGDQKVGIWRKKIGSARTRKKTQNKRFVLTPGFGDSPISWLLVISMIGPALRRAGFDEIVLLDFPGFNGRLVAEKCIPSLDLLFEAAEDIYDWLEPDTILGHSLGGWLTARYAVDCGAGLRPKTRRNYGYEGPSQVVLVAAAGVYESVQVRDSIGAIFADLVGTGGFDALRPHLFAKEPLWFGWVADGFSKFALDSGIRQFTESVREDHLVQNRLGDVRAKTWLIWGDRDTLVPTGGVGTWLEGLKSPESSATAVLIKGVGHSPQLEKPAVTAAALTQILLGREPHAKGARWWQVRKAASESRV
jgi:pimeloyl-ACP methyl ester carboxylesterase